MLPDFGGALIGADGASWYKFAARNFGATSAFRSDLWAAHHEVQANRRATRGNVE